MAYQPGVPTGSVPLNQDYKNLQGNFGALNTAFNTDHVPLTTTAGTPPYGYHTAIHLVPQSPIPTAMAGYGELYTQTLNDGINTGQQLWYQFITGTPVTINYPLTRNIQPVANFSGFTFLPGGMIMQWGQGTSGAPITFYSEAPFTNLFSIQITPFTAGAGLQTVITAPQAYSVSSTGFTVANNSGNSFVYYWLAIGV